MIQAKPVEIERTESIYRTSSNPNKLVEFVLWQHLANQMDELLFLRHMSDFAIYLEEKGLAVPHGKTLENKTTASADHRYDWKWAESVCLNDLLNYFAINGIAVTDLEATEEVLETIEETEEELLPLEEPAEEPDEVEKLDLLSTLRSISPTGFEKVCRELLRESGFENVEVTGGSADGGIDGYGTLEINPFVSFRVLFQCKRYAKGNLVSRAQVGDFRNTMLGRAEKGIILTTSGFSNAAIQEASREGAPQVELVDGDKLVDMFQRVELGVFKRTVYDVDPAYFEKFKE
jgi:restriction system protein